MPNAPIIVSAILADHDFAWLDGMRRAHFPAERNVIAAHLTMFHHLPPSLAPELKQCLAQIVREYEAPAATIAGLLNLGRGVAFRVESSGLVEIRSVLARRFSDVLIPQDQAGWRPHVTIQNKVAPAVSKALLTELASDFSPRPLGIKGIATWWYRDGPWEALSDHKFSRSAPSRRN